MRRPTRTIVALAAPLLAALALGCAAKRSPAPLDHYSTAMAEPYGGAAYDDVWFEEADAMDGEALAGSDSAPTPAAAPSPEPVAMGPYERDEAPSLAQAPGRGDRSSRKEARRTRRDAKGKALIAPTPPSVVVTPSPALVVTPPTVAEPTTAPPVVVSTPLPVPEHDTEAYAHIQENDFVAVADDPRSTFSIDVDTASYSNVRRFLAEGRLPPAAAVRIEELVNYFDYDYAKPHGADPFSVQAEVASCPWQPSHRLVRVGLRGKEVAAKEVPPRNLVFLVDVSGSMSTPDRLPLLKQGLRMLAEQIRAQDRVSIVVYAGASGVVLEPTSDRQAIKDALGRLEAGGSTNGGAGIELAYRTAASTFIKGGINRVILATDGDFNVGTTSQGELTRLIEKKRETGVFLSVLGFGRGNLGDATMELLADKGNGNYAYIDSEAEARKVLVEQAGATLMTIAKDVKIQVEWNPAEVAAYRLVGYENRRLAHADFNDDTKDAGEIGAGHTVTALYEVVPAGAGVEPQVDPLRYQATDAALSPAAKTGELMTVKLRYKQPDGNTSKLLSVAVRDGDRALEDSSDDFRFAAAVAELGLLLRGSKWRGKASWAQTHALAAGALGRDPHGRRAELLELVRKAAAFSGEEVPTTPRGPKVAR
jgi:Ca-activated chloride channel homolog